MILDRIPDKVFSPHDDNGETRLVFESTSAFDGSTGSSWLIVQGSQVLIVSAQPLGDADTIRTFTITDASALKCSKSILGDINLEFTFRGDQQAIVFVIPSLLLHEWDALSQKLQIIFKNIYNPEVTDASLGCNSNISSGSLILPVASHDILFKPISGVKIDESHMQSFLDTTMDGLADQINVSVTDENSFKISDVRSDGMPVPSTAAETPPSGHSGDSKKKKYRKAPQTNLLSSEPVSSAEDAELLRCPQCSKMNKPGYLYCLGCGRELDSGKNTSRRKGGKSREFGYSASDAPQAEEASGCIVQLFYFIIGAGALLFFISLGK